jgi:hypothetical protein
VCVTRGTAAVAHLVNIELGAPRGHDGGRGVAVVRPPRRQGVVGYPAIVPVVQQDARGRLNASAHSATAQLSSQIPVSQLGRGWRAALKVGRSIHCKLTTGAA